MGLEPRKHNGNGRRSIDEILSLSSPDVEPLRKPICLHTVEETEVDHLGSSTHVVGHIIGIDTVDSRSGCSVNIHIVGEGIDEPGIL